MTSTLRSSPTEDLFNMLQTAADMFNSRPDLQDEMKGTQGWINTIIGFKTNDNKMQHSIVVKDGHISMIKNNIPPDAGATLVFATEKDLSDYQAADNDEICRMILSSRVRVEGNMALYGYFTYLGNLLFGKDEIKASETQKKAHEKENLELAEGVKTLGRNYRKVRSEGRLSAKNVDPGVKWLDEPYLSKYDLDDFPRVKKFKEEYHKTLPEVSAEQGKLLTDFYIEHGYETKKGTGSIEAGD